MRLRYWVDTANRVQQIMPLTRFSMLRYGSWWSPLNTVTNVWIPEMQESFWQFGNYKLSTETCYHVITQRPIYKTSIHPPSVQTVEASTTM